RPRLARARVRQVVGQDLRLGEPALSDRDLVGEAAPGRGDRRGNAEEPQLLVEVLPELIDGVVELLVDQRGHRAVLLGAPLQHPELERLLDVSTWADVA